MMKLLNQDLKDVGHFNILLLHLTDRETETQEVENLLEGDAFSKGRGQDLKPGL